MFIFIILITQDNRPDNELFLFKLLGYLTLAYILHCSDSAETRCVIMLG